jgi:uncharacterized protein (TIGR04255 family)
MSLSASPLPMFDNPPAVEKVLGVQFQPIVGIGYGHYGWFWKSRLDESWTKTQDAPRLPDQFEKFGDQLTWGIPDPKFSLGGQDRMMLINSANDRLIQIQDTRFLYNWKKQEEPQRPFSELYREFDNCLRMFTDFLTEAGLLPTVPNQWEMTYVNHVPKGALWESASDWSTVFPGLFGRIQNPTANVKLEAMSTAFRFEIPPKRGRVHTQFQHAKTLDSNEEVLMLSLTARGPLSGDEGWDLSSSMAIGHEALVRTFVDISSSAALAHWGLR